MTNVLSMLNNLQFCTAPFGAELSRLCWFTGMVNTTQLGIGRRFFCALGGKRYSDSGATSSPCEGRTSHGQGNENATGFMVPTHTVSGQMLRTSPDVKSLA